MNEKLAEKEKERKAIEEKIAAIRAEIAQITGRREATVRSDLKRARDRLREMLKEASDFE